MYGLRCALSPSFKQFFYCNKHDQRISTHFYSFLRSTNLSQKKYSACFQLPTYFCLLLFTSMFSLHVQCVAYKLQRTLLTRCLIHCLIIHDTRNTVIDTARYSQVHPGAEMGIYRGNLSAIVYYRLSLSLKIVLIYRLPISLLQCISLWPINYRDKRFCMHIVFKFSELAL